MQEPVYFVCGALRSGTTLLRLMLDEHPRLSNPAEMDFLFDAPRDAAGEVRMGEFVRLLKRDRVVGELGLKVAEGLSYPDLLRSLIDQLRAPGKKLSINVHRNFERIPEVFPDAKYIHIVRDPRDVAKSSIGMGWAGNVYNGVDHWMLSEASFERLAGRVPPEAILNLRHEDLLTRPQAELERVCAFMGESYDPAMLTYPARSTYGAPDPSMIGDWRQALSSKEVGLVEGKIGAMLTERGYEPSGHPALTPAAFDRFRLKQQNRAFRLRFSARRFGPWLTFLDLLRRFVPHSGFDDYVSRKLDRIAVQHLK